MRIMGVARAGSQGIGRTDRGSFPEGRGIDEACVRNGITPTVMAIGHNFRRCNQKQRIVSFKSAAADSTHTMR
jgi:hypothetical protein